MKLATDALGISNLPGDLDRVEAALKASVQTDDPFLNDVATHLIAAGGKRLRPTLELCAAYVSGLEEASEESVMGAVAVELVHLGSLYHDDVIDEASVRRGVPSVNARWSNIVAILAGDFLLARASEIAADLGVEVAGLLGHTIAQLCKGQVLELQRLFDIERDEADYLGAISGKTAALMATSCRVGGLVSGLDRGAIEALTAFGHHVGVGFQIVDDVLDLVSDDSALGKPAGKDLAEGVYTLPVILALRRSPELRSLLGSTLDPEALARARRLTLDDGRAVEASLAIAREHVASARRALEEAGLTGDLVEGMCCFAESLLERSS